MKFSEAIRLGSMTTKPARGIETDGKRACARGAALLAAGFYNADGSTNTDKTQMVDGNWTSRNGTTVARVTMTLRADAWPPGWLILLRFTTRCPITHCMNGGAVWDLIAHLNDGHRWTRERIADWVEVIENQIEAEKPAAELVPVAVRSERP